MAEQTFRSPGFFEQEIDLSSRVVSPTGTPGGVIGTADRGPAFVPVTIGSFADFQTKFGTLHPDRFMKGHMSFIAFSLSSSSSSIENISSNN